MPPRHTVVIVGASLAGGRAAEQLRKEGFDGRIVLFGEEIHPPYERPPLSKELLRGEWPVDRTFLHPAAWYLENEIELELGARVMMVDPVERAVMGAGRMIDADAILLATGGRPRTLPVPGIHLDGVLVLRTLEDAQALAPRLQPGARVVVIGAGFIGCEVAASARSMGCEVAMVDIFRAPLVRALGEEVGGLFADLHRDHGVRLHLGTAVESIEGRKRAEAVMLQGDVRLEADVVVVGVGIEPSDELAREAGLECDNGIVVNERCETSAPGIYAAGDVANHPNPILGERVRLEHWQNAQNQGAAAAQAMVGHLERFAEVPWFWSDQYEVNVQVAGHPSHYDRLVLRGSRDERDFVAFYLEEARLLAAVGVNRGREVRAARRLIEQAIPVADDVLADESTDLRTLARSAAR